jgi:glycosyltransferase involved in cell wall biosynthesis
LLSAFASGMPVVTSPEALPDPAAVANKHFVAAHSAPQMAAQIVRLLQERGSYDSMAQLASRLAARYDWELVGESFARVVLAAAERRRA